MRNVVGALVVPVLLGGSLALVHGLLAAGHAESLVLFGVLCGAGLVILVIQRLLPHVPEWRRWEEEATVDLLHLVLSTGLAGAVAKGALFALLLGAQVKISTVVGGSLWPTELHLGLQLALALLITDFGAYWLHRLSHELTPLWRLHALHHSSERLYMLSSGRNHPVHTTLTYAVQTTPIVLLGGQGELLALFSAFTAVNGMLQHANIAYRLGPLNWILATADLHRWHHSTVLEESRTNYGNNLIVWDILFGTRRLPGAGSTPAAVGLGPDGASFPRTWWGHLKSPFTWREPSGAAESSRQAG